LALAAAFALATHNLMRRAPPPRGAAAGAVFSAGGGAGPGRAPPLPAGKGGGGGRPGPVGAGGARVAAPRAPQMARAVFGIIAVLLLARIAWDPRIVGDNVGTTPIFNWLLWGYGVPAVSFWVAGRILRRRADDFPSRAVDSAAILFTALAAMFQIRHLMNDG